MYSAQSIVYITLSVRDAVGRYRPPYVDDSAAVGHLVFAGVFAGVVVVDGVDDTQVQEQAIQHLHTQRPRVRAGWEGGEAGP